MSSAVFRMAAPRQTRLLKERRLIDSFTHGSMANALPQSIGAQFCYPGRQVIAMAGDGGLAMLMGDLLTMTQYDLPIPTAEWFGGGDLSVAADPHNLGASDSSSPHKRPQKAHSLICSCSSTRTYRSLKPSSLSNQFSNNDSSRPTGLGGPTRNESESKRLNSSFQVFDGFEGKQSRW